ncbi:MAG TPA: hypothetical protein VI757_09755 [Bacteroidia bacterium]|nr:hypothetical protein [Bacteroidia bacterium]
MINKILCVSLVAIAITLFSSCGDSQKSGTENPDDTAKTTNTSPVSGSGEAGNKYGIKSGIITYDNEAMGMAMKTTLYFDNYGKSEATETEMELEMMGVKSKTHTISFDKDGYSYNLDLEKKTGTKMKQITTGSGMDSKGMMDFSKMSEQMMKDMQIKKEGNETVLGKDCTVYSIGMDIGDQADAKGSKMQIKGKYAVWNNIMMKMDTDMSGMKVTMKAVKIQENVPVPADKFEVPQGITVTEP